MLFTSYPRGVDREKIGAERVTRIKDPISVSLIDDHDSNEQDIGIGQLSQSCLFKSNSDLSLFFSRLFTLIKRSLSHSPCLPFGHKKS